MKTVIVTSLFFSHQERTECRSTLARNYMKIKIKVIFQQKYLMIWKTWNVPLYVDAKKFPFNFHDYLLQCKMRLETQVVVFNKKAYQLQKIEEFSDCRIMLRKEPT